MQSAYTVLILLMLVGVSRLIGRLIPLPLPLVQIGAGAVLAWPSLGLHVALDPELFLFLFLPPLLFSDGWRMPKRELWRLRGPILTLAVGLVLFTVVGAGYFIHWLLPGIPLPVAFALAAVLSPTDAVAVSAIARDRLPAPLMHMLQGEALMNDASGLVTFKFALAAAITGVFFPDGCEPGLCPGGGWRLVGRCGLELAGGPLAGLDDCPGLGRSGHPRSIHVVTAVRGLCAG